MPKIYPAALLTLCLFAGGFVGLAKAQPDLPRAATSSPEAQAVRVYQALRDQDWKAMYYLMAFSPKAKAEVTLATAESFAADVQKGYAASFKTAEEKETTDKLFKSIAGIMVGEAVITGNTAVVPTSARLTVNDQTVKLQGAAHLISEEGVWKLDLTFSDDTEQATAQRVSELLGKRAAGQ